MKIEDIHAIIVLGAGIMGNGIAQSFAEAGYSVRLIDQNRQILDTAFKQIEVNLKLFEEFDLINEPPATIKSRIQSFLPDQLVEASKGCSIVIEALPESLELKGEWFKKLDALEGDFIMASNTSSLTISAISEGMKNASRVVGLHYFNPAHIIPAVEIHTGKKTSDETVAIARELMIKTGKKPVLVRKEVPGFIINRLTGAMEREIDFLLDEGVVSPEELDIAVRASYGFRLANLGPMEGEDMIGLDTSARVSSNMFKVLSNKTEPSPSLLEKVERGELGIKSGSGWYDYSNKSREDVTNAINKRLLSQLALFRSFED